MGSGVSSMTGRVKSPPKPSISTTVSHQVHATYGVQNSPQTDGRNSEVGSGSGRLQRVPPVSETIHQDGADEMTDRLLSSGHIQETPAQDCMYTGRSANSDGAAVAEMFAHTALSLGMDNEDLLFNLMYFSEEGEGATLGAVMEGVQNETLALHSENNTPYKLKPASASAILGLQSRVFGVNLHNDECECQVCKDEIEVENTVIQIPSCQHFFHEECLLRWIQLQGWCPVCRAPIEHKDENRTPFDGGEHEWQAEGAGAGEEGDSPAAGCHADAEQETMTLPVSSKGPSLRLFDGDDEVVVSGGGNAEPLTGRSPRAEAKLPGGHKCIV